MPRKPASEEQRQAVRKRIQKAAAKLFADEGAAGVSARAIAGRAGVSVGTLYAYFSDLQGLMQSLWMEPVAHIDVLFTQVARENADPVQRLRALLGAYAEFALKNPELYRGAFLFVRPKVLPAPEKAALESAVFPGLLIDAVRDGQSAGLLRSGDPRRLAQIFWAGLHGCLALPVNFDRLAFDEAGPLARDVIDMLMTAAKAET
ncbi:MAG: TetR/AcrR family transcriptional regulator [Caulobacter sp.]|nr:TetR/AcrR family transcriptional regulator [Caulobacter sp.]